jgi:hypothetical protein
MNIHQGESISGPVKGRPALPRRNNSNGRPKTELRTLELTTSKTYHTMKTIFLITIICAATAQAQSTSDWSVFDSGHATQSTGAVTHSGVFSGWSGQPMSSVNYTNQQGYPSLPMPVQTPGAPVLTSTLVGQNARVAWPASSTEFTLQETAAIGTGASWSSVPGPYQENGGERFILVPASQAIRFYRLMAP